MTIFSSLFSSFLLLLEKTNRQLFHYRLKYSAALLECSSVHYVGTCYDNIFQEKLIHLGNAKTVMTTGLGLTFPQSGEP